MLGCFRGLSSQDVKSLKFFCLKFFCSSFIPPFYSKTQWMYDGASSYTRIHPSRLVSTGILALPKVEF
ncbi:unnamed protein product [Victoria cruziana]